MKFRNLSIYVVTALSPLLLIGGCQKPRPLTVTVLHWNDFHAHNLPFTTVFRDDTVKVGGIAHLAALLDSLKEVEPRALTLHAGDEFTGSPICALSYGKSQIDLLNLVGPDAFEVGNHEFDVGLDTLKARLSEARFPVLCGNVIDEATGNPIGLTSIILERDGVKIGIIGVNTRHLSSLVMGEAVKGLRIDEPIDLVNRLLDELESKTDIQIALTHQGVGEDQRLAQSCPRLDLIVGGHQHTRLFEPLVENGVPILQAGANGMFLGRFRAEVDTAEDRIISYAGELIPVYTDSIRPRDDIAVVVAEQEGSISSELDRVIGYLKSPWNRSWDGESNVGNWTTDSMIRLSGRDIAFLNSGGLRRDIPAGPVTLRDIWELHPFGNYLQGFELTGEKLYDAVSYSAQRGGDAVQVGGIRFKARSTGEVLELTVMGKPVEMDEKYSVIANEYFVEHIDRYMGLDLSEHEIIDLGWIDRELVEKAVIEEDTIDSRVDGRIDVIEESNE